jgi:O-antigen/teichoic acid export membrane protein/transposase
MVAPAAPLSITDGQREVLAALLRSHTAPVRQVRRAEALLLAADGVSNTAIAKRCDVARATVLAWRKHFEEHGLVKFGEVAKGRGVKPSIPEETVAELVRLTTQTTPEGATHWSVRAMANQVGISPASVQRIWSQLGLKPHLVQTFEVSTDARFQEKLIDGVGLDPNTPDKAVVLCTDEKSPVQSQDRTQPSLPLKRGRADTTTHDDERHGTTTLFATLNPASERETKTNRVVALTRRTSGPAIVRNAMTLMVSSIVASFLGVCFWLIGARLYNAEELGRASAAISAIGLLSGFAQLSQSGVMVRFLPTAGRRTLAFLQLSHVAVTSLAIILAVAFWFLGGANAFLPQNAMALMIFCAAVVGLALSGLHDGALTGLGHAPWILTRNGAVAVVRLVLLVVLAGGTVAAVAPVLSGWVAPMALNALATAVLLITHLGPRHAAQAAGRREIVPTGRELTSFVSSQYLNGLLVNVTQSAPPVLVTMALGATINGSSFYIPWLIANVAGALSWNVTSSFVVEASRDPGRIRAHLRHTLTLLSIINVLGGLILVAAAPLLLRVLGQQYVAGTGTLRLIGLSMPFGMVGVMHSTLRVLNKRRWPSLWINCAYVPATVGGIWWALPRFGVEGAAGAFLIVAAAEGLALLPVTVRLIRRLVGASVETAVEEIPAAQGVATVPVRARAAVPAISPGLSPNDVQVVFFPPEVIDWERFGAAETVTFNRRALGVRVSTMLMPRSEVEAATTALIPQVPSVDAQATAPKPKLTVHPVGHPG